MLSPPISFKDMPGWHADDHRAALAAFRRHCRHPAGFPDPERLVAGGPRPDQLRALCPAAEDAWAAGTPQAARVFFETSFIPRRIRSKGFLTGYFEPEFAGARARDAMHRFPWLRKPDNLVAIDPVSRPPDIPNDHGFALKSIDGKLKMPPDRGAIMDGALDNAGLELVWLADPVDAFYIHVQGSARIRLADGGMMRVGYAGKTGHPYFPIRRVMIERGLARPGTVTMDVLRDWLAANPDEIDGVLRRNPSYIFFREVTQTGPDDGPIGAAGLPLVSGRSLAVDKSRHVYGTPVFVSARLPLQNAATETAYHRLMIAEDTGSAIVGPARADLFLGSGEQAGAVAGRIQHEADLIVLLPREAGPSSRARQ